MASFILMTEAQCLAAREFDTAEIHFGGRKIDNELANLIGEGTLVGGETDYYVVNAVLLNDPDYVVYRPLCLTYSIITVEPEVLFLPDPEV